MSDVSFRRSRRGVFLFVFLLAFVLTACATSQDKYVEKPVEDLYTEALDALQKGNYTQASQSFDEVERQHPYSSWATKAQLMSAYSHYEAGKYDDALIALNRFIQLHPSHQDTPYAYYLKALCYYEQISDIGRDQRLTLLAQQALEEVVTRFPTSIYARDAKLKVDLTRDHLAGKEMEVGRYYLKQKQYLAAVNRFKVVVDYYSRTSHAPEALYRLTEAYTILGLKTEARKAASVLGYNFPDSDWYQDAYRLTGVVPQKQKSQQQQP